MKIKIPYGYRNVTMNFTDIGKGRFAVKFPFHRKAKDDVKESFGGAKWDVKNKYWTVEDSFRTWFTIDVLKNGPMIQRYDAPITDQLIKETVNTHRPLYDYQRMMVCQALIRHRVFWAVHMGLGKTIAAAEVMEHVRELYPDGNSYDLFWVICPKNIMRTWKDELEKWDIQVLPQIISNHEKSITKAMEKAPFPPRFVVWDEAQGLKGHKTKRTKLAFSLGEEMFRKYRGEEYIIGMSGTPQPKDARDWWSQIEAVCPGFFRENTWYRFQDRIAIVEKEDGDYGSFNSLKTFKDGKCSICETPKDNHNPDCVGFTPKVTCSMCGRMHTFHNDCGMFVSGEEPVNEVEKLVKRMKGLTICLKEEDCKNLPPVQYEEIQCMPTKDMLTAAEMVAEQETTTIGILSKLRQFSDGFLYQEDDKGVRQVNRIPDSPKEIELKNFLNLLKTNEENRVIIAAGFQASVDLCIEVSNKLGWDVIAADSRGWRKSLRENFGKEREDREAQYSPTAAAFRNTQRYPQPMAIIGHPATIGEGQNLQSSRYLLFYSNDFNGKNRIQCEARPRRADSKQDRIIIVDFHCLGIDRVVSANLKAKKDAQNLTLDEIKRSIM